MEKKSIAPTARKKQLQKPTILLHFFRKISLFLYKFNPDNSNFQKCSLVSSLKRTIAAGSRNRAAAVTRKAPTSSGAKTFSPCLIRMKDVPQIRARIINKKMAEARGLSDILVETLRQACLCRNGFVQAGSA